ncbi:MAG: nitrogen regulation protein NR(I) [Sphingomonas sp.]
MGHILVVDDDTAIRTVVGQALRRAGHHVRSVATLAEMRAAIDSELPDLLISDVVLPDGNGLDAAASVLASHPGLPVIILSAQNTLTTAVRATEVGAYDYLPKPFDLDALSRAVAAALARGQGQMASAIDEADAALPLIGRSMAMQDVYRVIARVVANDLTVLITGESGTGKELVAQAIHDLGPRRARPLVAINMAAIPRELIEAELFGHERGAFTGAQARMAGRFEQAAGGTLFLDEIGDMPMDAQTRLLRVLQSGEFTTVGGARPIRADVRIIAATNRDLAALVASGQFREDLFYRLNVVPIALPPLRDRRQDIALLARHFVERAVTEGLPRRQLSEAALEALAAHDWPGNVRELENIVRRVVVLARDDVIDASEISSALGSNGLAPGPLPTISSGNDVIATAIRARLDQIAREHPQAIDDGTLYDRIIGEVERPLIQAMLARYGQNQLRAARAMGINRNTLRKRLDQLGINPGADGD